MTLTVEKLFIFNVDVLSVVLYRRRSFSTVRVTQRGSQRYMEKRRGRRELEVTQMR